jgi:hypothetical protein
MAAYVSPAHVAAITLYQRIEEAARLQAPVLVDEGAWLLLLMLASGSFDEGAWLLFQELLVSCTYVEGAWLLQRASCSFVEGVRLLLLASCSFVVGA